MERSSLRLLARAPIGLPNKLAPINSPKALKAPWGLGAPAAADAGSNGGLTGATGFDLRGNRDALSTGAWHR